VPHKRSTRKPIAELPLKKGSVLVHRLVGTYWDFFTHGNQQTQAVRAVLRALLDAR